MKKPSKIEIRSRDYANFGTFWNVWLGGKIVGKFSTREKAEKFVANRWYKLSREDRARAALDCIGVEGDTTDLYDRAMNAMVTEIEARERPN